MKKYQFIFFCLLYLVFVGLSHKSFSSDDKYLKSQLSRKTSQITLIKKTYYLDSKLVIPSGKQVNANGSTFVFNKVIPNQWMITLNSGCKLSNLEISGLGETSEFNFVLNGAEVYRKFNFNYTQSFNVIWLMGKQISLDNIKINGCQKGIGGNVTQANMNRINIKGSYASIEMYISRNIKVTNSTFYGGSFGCITFPSCSDITVENCILYNPKSTGVNPGGATDTNLNAKHIVIKNNYVVAGDCINLENGAEYAEIEFNDLYCAPIIDQFINNNAIGVQTHDPKANGKIHRIRIENNKIHSYKGLLYATGINIGNIIGNTVHDVTIKNNYIEGANEGMRLHSLPKYPFKQCTIRNNTLLVHAFGIRLAYITGGELQNNNLSSYNSTWNNNLIGIQLQGISNLSISNNITKGFDKHYYQYSECSQVQITNPTFDDKLLMRKGQLLYVEKEISSPLKINFNAKK